ncbi:MAG: enoyl-CoA hydratase [Alphaproteobacteria bacterium]|nr:enoyl-CoA hydratase [Alphaproteobacteria bacterium]
MATPVIVSTTGAVATITLNRPQAKNALDAAAAKALREAVEQAAGDAAVRAVLLRGAGDAFSAGGDVRLFADQAEQAPEVIRAILANFHPAISLIRRMAKPVIAAVHGAVAGGGLGLAMACDLVIAARSAVFTVAYTQIGASPDGSTSYLLPRLVGLRVALGLSFLNDRVDAETALRLGLVSRVVETAELERESTALAARLAEGPTAAFARTKALLNAAVGGDLDAHLAREAEAITASAASADFREGVTAFRDKRKPRFRGS